MTLAIAAAKAAPFNALLYATIATIIPVLFLAIAVQGTLYQDLIKTAERVAAKAREQRRYPHAAMSLLSICGLVIIYGAAGEITALIALSRQTDGFWQHYLAWPAGIVLTLIAAAGPARILLKALSDTARHAGKLTWLGKPAHHPPGEPEHEPGQPPPETGTAATATSDSA